MQNLTGSSSRRTPTEDRVIAENFSSGDFNIDFSAYMISKMGRKNNTNFDNFYMNGIFMNHFKFTDVKKSITCCGSTAVFAVASGKNSERSSKLALSILDQHRENIAASKTSLQIKKNLRKAILDCNMKLIEEGHIENEIYETSIAVAVYYKETIFYCICGNCMIVNKNKKTENFKTRCQALGLTENINISIGKCRLFKENELVMCSDGIAAINQTGLVETEIMNNEKSKEIAVRIVEKSLLVSTDDSTCMAINTVMPSGIRNNTVIFACICMLVTITNILLCIVLD